MIYSWRSEHVNLSSGGRGGPDEKHTGKHSGGGNYGPSESTIPMSEVKADSKRTEKDDANGERDDNNRQKSFARNCRKRGDPIDLEDQDAPPPERDGKVECANRWNHVLK